MRLFHIVAPVAWASAIERGEYAPSSLETEGFVHFSFADQVEIVANARYRDEPDLQVIELDSADISHEIRVEDSYGSGTDFPHVYGAIDPRAPVAIHPLTRDEAGNWRFILRA